MEKFSDDQEAKEWLLGKVTDNPARPHRYHKDNWWLDEYYVEYDGGIDTSNSSKITEKLQRTSNDCAAAISSLGMENENGKKKQSMDSKVRQWVGKVNMLSQRLAKQISSVELKLPSFKRSMSGQKFAQLKAGLTTCRETKEKVWDELEDMREPKSGEQELLDQLTALQGLHSTLTEHLDALQEAISKHQQPEQPPIKEEGASQQGDGAEVAADP